MAAELDSIFSELERACQRLNALHSHLVMGELEPFYRIENRVTACMEAACRARTEAFLAKQEFGIEHPQRTKGMDLQRSAVRLALAYFEHSGRGQVRARSKEIMQKAGLPEPDESTVTKWIKEFREEFRTPAPSVPIRLNVK